MIITVVFRCHGATRQCGVACKIGKAKNLMNLHCIQRETAYVSPFGHSCIGLECKCQYGILHRQPRYTGAEYSSKVGQKERTISNRFYGIGCFFFAILQCNYYRLIKTIAFRVSPITENAYAFV